MEFWTACLAALQAGCAWPFPAPGAVRFPGRENRCHTASCAAIRSPRSLSRGAPAKGGSFSPHNPFAFANDNQTVRGNAAEFVGPPAGPSHRQVRPGGAAQSEMQPEIVYRIITRLSSHFLRLPLTAIREGNPRSDSAPVGLCAD